ncbi:MAG: LacI family DNA-binding transcriptional regulator [Chitinispirillaceae bacterium]|nr:LacI family DNA-binding transcriptional regulator [Chitinispirillaceae bacterium]
MLNARTAHTTIKDIAKQLGVAPSTVTKALKDYPDVSEGMKEKARGLAKKMGYLPNSVAQSLQSGETTTIGVIVPEIKHHFFSAALDGIEEVAFKEGYSIFVCKSNEDYEREVINTRNLLSHFVAGIIVSISQHTKDVGHFIDVQARKIPLVFFDRVSDEIAANKVVVDDRAGASSAVAHLIESGYKRIAHLAGPDYLNISKERLKGYAAALKKAGIPFNADYLIYGGFDEEDGVHGFKRLMKLRPRPDALFCVNDPVALGVLLECKKRKVRVPEELAVVGFSDNPVVSQIDPPLTTVAQPAYEMGAVAAKMLLQQIRHGNGDFVPEVIKLKTKLMIRKTT